MVGDMIDENSDNGKFVESEFENLGLDKNNGKLGFYLGLSSSQLGVFDRVCTHSDDSAEIMAQADLLWYTHCFGIPNQRITEIIGPVPNVEKKLYGPLTYEKSEGCILGITVTSDPMNHYIVCKIYRDYCLHEVQLSRTTFSCEVMPDSQW